MRGAEFVPYGDGVLYPKDATSSTITGQAYRECCAAVGLDNAAYVRLMRQEGPDFLRRFPGIH